jgi:DNA-directed RNA polymerase subunit RPC12/RpoP
METETTETTDGGLHVERNKCPNCGAALSYDIKTGTFKCDHCEFKMEIDANERVERHALSGQVLAEKRNWAEGRVFRCENCGAKAVIDGKTISTNCPFCGHPTVVCSDEISGIKPDAILPFKFDTTEARALFGKWMRGKWFAPKAFKRADVRESISQLFCPVWSFTTYSTCVYRGTLGRMERRGDKMQLHWFPVSGVISAQYTDYMIQSSTSISQKTFADLQPYDLTSMKPYRSEFVAGIRTEHYSRELEECFNDFANAARLDFNKKIMQKHHADRSRNLDLRLAFENKKFNYLLLPVYVASYEFKKKKFNFFVNGHSREVVGNYPISKFKVIIWGFLATAVTAGLFWFFKR